MIDKSHLLPVQVLTPCQNGPVTVKPYRIRMLEGLCFEHTNAYNYIKHYTNHDGHHSRSAARTRP